MGADNFLQLPKWKNWTGIMNKVPIAVISRPGKNNTALKARLGTAAQKFKYNRLPENQAHILKYHDAPAWCYLTPPMNRLSSTAIRARRSS